MSFIKENKLWQMRQIIYVYMYQLGNKVIKCMEKWIFNMHIYKRFTYVDRKILETITFPLGLSPQCDYYNQY